MNKININKDERRLHTAFLYPGPAILTAKRPLAYLARLNPQENRNNRARMPQKNGVKSEFEIHKAKPNKLETVNTMKGKTI